MQIRNWINSKRVEMRKFVFLFCLVLLSMLTFSVAQAQQPGAPSTSTPFGLTGLNTPAKDITMAGTVQQLITTHPSGTPVGVQLAVDGPQGLFTASLGPNLSREVQQSLSEGAPVQISGQMQMINSQQYLLARKITVAGKQIVVRNDNGFLVHSSQGARAFVNNTAGYRSAK
jgi:hypothetical protein